MSIASKGRVVTEETKKKISESKKGKSFSEETREKIREARKGRVVTKETRKKMSESHKGNKSNTGKKFSEEVKKKISESQKGKLVSEETKKKLSEARRGRKMVPLSEEHKKKISVAGKGRKGKSPSEETRKKISESQVKHNLEFGYTGGRGHGKFGIREDLNQIFRSTWEANYARYLNSCGIEWVFEKYWFDTPYGTYRPDFYLPQFDMYIEVKGWENGGKQFSKRQWLKDNNVINLVEVWGDTYNTLCKIYQDVLPYWEKKNVV